MRLKKYSEGLSEGLVQAMEQDPNIFMTGIAVDYPSGIFGSTVEATNRFGPKRVFDSPAMENALTGIAIGAALMGKRPIVVHPRNDFMFLAFDQMINVAAKWRYMFEGNAGACAYCRSSGDWKRVGPGGDAFPKFAGAIGAFPWLDGRDASFPH